MAARKARGWQGWTHRAARAVLAAVSAVGISACAAAQADTLVAAIPAELDLHLEIYLNGVSTQLIAHVRQTPAGRLLMEPESLRKVGLLPVAGALREDGWMDMGLLPGVRTRYIEATQTLSVEAEDAAMQVRMFDVQAQEWGGDGADATPSAVRENFGMFINHTFYASTGGDRWAGLGHVRNASALFETNLSGRLGTFTSTQLMNLQRGTGAGEVRRFRSQRLDTQWAWFDEHRLMTLSAGDVIGSSLSWSRSVRLGGVQLRRNFAIRPDLVTMPMLSQLTGSAVVPSTVELYVNNARQFSQEVAPGPFAITNLPLMTGAGTARLVVRDALGRETISETPFYASNRLLAKGLSDFSLDAGFARRNYGSESNDYDKHLLASTTLRYGLTNAATLEGHVQGGGRLVLAGTGGVFRLGHHGAGGLAAAFSRYGTETGAQFAANLEWEALGMRLYARHQQTTGDFNDLASISLTHTTTAAEHALMRRNARPPRRMGQVSLSLPYWAGPSVNLAYTPITQANGNRSRLFGANLGQRLPGQGWLSVSAYRDLERTRSTAVFLMLSWFLDGRYSASTSQSWQQGQLTRTTAELSQSARNEDGSVGWRMRATHGHAPGQPHTQTASASYRSRVGRIEAGIEQVQYSASHSRPAAVNGRLQFDGAVVLGGGGVFFANRIYDAFGVVNVGAPDVLVRFENSPYARTNARGQVLLAGLRAYERNHISIDPMTLPVDARIPVLRQTVRPRWKSGVVVDFGVILHPRTALLSVRDEAGELLPVGAQARLNDGTEVVIGYDGQVWLDGIGTHNRLRVQRPDSPDCVVDFDAPASMSGRLVIPDAVCRSEP